ncbi:MAG: hypothetical protein K2P63_08920, partial [Lachnospiraceae bacterium]|nr:hypothetical protein [Lachnospiraceae bacterium]
MKSIFKKIESFVLAVIVVCAILPFQADASYEIPGVCQVQTDIGIAGVVKTLDYSYENNTYL